MDILNYIRRLAVSELQGYSNLGEVLGNHFEGHRPNSGYSFNGNYRPGVFDYGGWNQGMRAGTPRRILPSTPVLPSRGQLQRPAVGPHIPEDSLPPRLQGQLYRPQVQHALPLYLGNDNRRIAL